MLDLKRIAKEKKQLAGFIENRLQSHFDLNLVNFKKRCRVEGDLEKWSVNHIDMANQESDKESRWYSIYFDNEFVCSFQIARTPAEVELLFLNNLTKMFESEEIFFDKNEYIIREEFRKAEERKEQEKIDSVVNSAPSEVKQLIKEIDETAK